MQDNRDKEAGIDKAQTEHKRIQKKNIGVGEIFLTLPERPCTPSQPPVQWVPGLFLPPSAEVKERIELYLYSPSEFSWPRLGRYLPF